MNKCYYKFARLMAVTVAMGVMTSACSDDEPEYTDDIYFTGSQAAVEVVSAKGSGNPASGLSALKVTFNAASNWQIAAKDFADPAKNADWVSFLTTAGEEGSQLLGVYVAANATGKDRAAMIEISSNGKTAAFTLVQSATGGATNPNNTAIDAEKTISKIEYYAAGATTPSKTIEFTYSNDVLASELVTVTDGENSTQHGYVISVEGNVNKVTVTPSDRVNEGQMFAVLDGVTAQGYNALTVVNNTNLQLINFGYAQDHLSAISGAGISTSCAWNNGNLTAIENNQASLAGVTYSTELNDCNLDLNWFIGLQNARLGVADGSNALGAMNLLGKRSANLVASASGENFNYTMADDGITVTTSSNRTIKVHFAK